MSKHTHLGRVKPVRPFFSDAATSGGTLLASAVAGLAFLFALAAWMAGWTDARAWSALVFGLLAFPLGPLFLLRLWRSNARASATGLAFLASCTALWLAACVPALLFGLHGARDAHPLVVLLAGLVLAGIALSHRKTP